MTSKYESFNLEIEDNIANIILSRPEQLNSMSRKFWVERLKFLKVNRNSEIRVLIISSTGNISVRAWIYQHLITVWQIYQRKKAR